MRSLVEGIAARLNGAAGQEIGTILRSIDIAASLKEWPALCEIARRYTAQAPAAVAPAAVAPAAVVRTPGHVPAV